MALSSPVAKPLSLIVRALYANQFIGAKDLDYHREVVIVAAARAMSSVCVTGLCGFLVLGPVMAALRVVGIVAELRQLLIKRLDRGFLLPQHFLDQFVAFALDGLLLGEEFINIVFRHGFYIVRHGPYLANRQRPGSMIAGASTRSNGKGFR